jgi:hypothetical protein
MKHALLVLLLSCLAIPAANAKLLFEGYYKIEQSGKHVGYMIVRDEIEDASKERKLSYLVWETHGGSVSQDGLIVTAKPAPPPQRWAGVKFTNWQYSDRDGFVVTGTFAGNDVKIEAKDRSGNPIEEKSGVRHLKAGTILSALSTQIAAENAGAKYTRGYSAKFEALNEEEQKDDTLEFEILESKDFADQKVSQVRLELRNDIFELFTFADGQALGSRASFDDKITYLVGKRKDAFGELAQSDLIKTIFGPAVPFGLENPVSKAEGKLNAKEIIESFADFKTIKEKKYKKR